MLITLWVVTLVVFSLSRAWGDPREMYWNKGTTKEQWDAWGREWGLDKPLPVQYLVWLGNALRGNLGLSMVARKPVTEYMFAKLPATMLLSLASVGFTLLGIPIGVLSAVKRGTIWDLAGRFFAVLNQAVPPFWLGLMLILIFSVQLAVAARCQDAGWVEELYLAHNNIGRIRFGRSPAPGAVEHVERLGRRVHQTGPL